MGHVYGLLENRLENGPAMELKQSWTQTLVDAAQQNSGPLARSFKIQQTLQLTIEALAT